MKKCPIAYIYRFCGNTFSIRKGEKIEGCCEQCDQKKLPNVYKSGPKTISIERIDFDNLQKFLKNVEDLGKLIIAKRL